MRLLAVAAVVLLAAGAAHAIAVPSPTVGPAPTASADNACDHTLLIADVTVAADHGTAICGGIGPGSPLVLPIPFFGDSVYCSMSFIVTNGTDLFVVSAGHCSDKTDALYPSLGERMHGLGIGEFGTLWYQWCEGGAINPANPGTPSGCGGGTDFELIHIDQAAWQYVRPEMCHFGAADGGLFTTYDEAQTLRPVHHFGWGMVLGEPASPLVVAGNPATQGRTGMGLEFIDDTQVLIESAAISGDSGSGVLVQELDQFIGGGPQRALGTLTHISAGGLAVVQRLDASLAHAEADLGLAAGTFRLVASAEDPIFASA